MKKDIKQAKEKYLKEKGRLETQSNTYSNARLIVFIISIVELIVYFNTHNYLCIILFILSLILFITLVIIHQLVDNKIQTMNNYLNLIKRYENRRGDAWKDEPYTYEENTMNFVKDLDIIGKNSLMQFLDFTSSLGGKKELIKTLTLTNVNETKIKDNQASIKELKENFNFVLSFKESLDSIENIDVLDFKESFSIFERKTNHKISHLILSIIISFLTILFGLLSLFKITTPVFFLVLFFLQLAISYIFSLHFKEEFDDIENASRIFSKLNPVFDFITATDFKSTQNLKLKSNIKAGKDILKELNKIKELNMFRTNFLTNIFLNVFFSLNFFLVHFYQSLLNKNTDTFKNSIASIEEFEVLISLTTVCFTRDNICLPTIESTLTLDINSMRHPLICESKCVENSFKCGRDINIITGSNMSGKTSFMRTIGINLILAYSGTYVNALKFNCPIMKIFTSINVKDDIANGISTFYGELKRIKNILDYSKKHNDNLIVFIDEIFKGTNYNDRILGAKETLKNLSNLNCIVFLTTHDFELCKINDLTIYNYHFAETYKDNKIHFDYQIKKGKCQTTNAKYLMEQMGLIERLQFSQGH